MTSQNGLLDIIRGRASGELRANDVDSLIDLAAAHGLIGHVYEALAKQQKSFATWTDAFDEQNINVRMQMQVAVEVGEAMQKAGIACVYAKGVAFNATIYDCRGVRPFTDLDLLIEAKDLRRTHDVLTGQGFVLSDDRSNPIEVSYRRERLPGFATSIDLHWDFASADSLQATERVPVAEILSRSMNVSGIPVPAPEDSLLLAASNLIRKSAAPLMLVADFARLSRLKMDWKVVAQRARTWGLSTGVWLGLTLAGALFGAEVPAEVAELAPSAWRKNWLLAQFRGERLWLAEKQSMFRYRIVFKLMCLNTFGELLSVCAALPRGAMRKAGLSKSIAVDLPRS
jgi:hypothetical protein